MRNARIHANYIKHTAHIAQAYINQRQDSLSREKKISSTTSRARKFHFSKFVGALGKETLRDCCTSYYRNVSDAKKKKKKELTGVQKVQFKTRS